MKRLRSIEDVARLAGVSKSTVSRALNGSPLIAEATKDRIMAIARQYGFRLNLPAQRLSLRASRTIAFVTHACHEEFSVADLFAFEIMGGIVYELYRRQYDLLLVQVDPRETEWATLYLDTGRVDAFILMTSMQKRHHIDHLLSIGAPFVAWGPGDGRYCSVCGNDRLGGSLATRHLLSLGRSRIAFIGGPRVELEVQRRYQGYAEALREAGVTLDPDLVTYGDYSDRSGAKAMERLLARGHGIDAVFVNSDLMAIAAMGCLKSRGLRVPEDVAVVGYDDLSIAAYATPPLTTVRQNVPMAGRLLARDLAAFLENGIITETVVPVDLVRRESA